MHLLIVTQRADKDDENLGAFYYWFEEFAKRFEHVTIIASAVGNVSFPSHVKVVTLGKEKGAGKLRRVLSFYCAFSRVWRSTDVVFFHQIPEFVIAAAPFLSFRGKRRISLWYAHGAVPRTLRTAERLVDFIFSSSASGFRLPSKKVIYTGQAVDTKRFFPRPQSHARIETLRMVTVGRIAHVKDYETIIRACAILKKTWPRQWTLSIIGGPLLPKDHEYFVFLKEVVAESDLGALIHFIGGRPFSEIPGILMEHDLFLNASRTGSLDKAVLEAMSAGLTVLTANEAYREFLPPQYFLDLVSPEFLAERIKAVADENRPNMRLRDIVIEQHGLAKTIDRITEVLRAPF